MSKQCLNCQTENLDNALFCKNCGAKFALEKQNEEQHSYAWIWWLIGISIVLLIAFGSNHKPSDNNATEANVTHEGNYTNTDNYYVSKPEPSVSILDKSQLLYCKAEKIRLDAVQDKIDLHSAVEVDKFNSLINDYNSRCDNKQYYEEDMYYVERNIEKNKSELIKEGIERFSLASNNIPENNSLDKKDDNISFEKSSSSQFEKSLSSDDRLDLSNLSSEETSSIEMACFNAKMNGPAKYNQCLKNQLTTLSSSTRRPDLSNLSSEETSSIEMACFNAKMNGPAKYNQCLQSQLRKLGQ